MDTTDDYETVRAMKAIALQYSKTDSETSDHEEQETSSTDGESQETSTEDETDGNDGSNSESEKNSDYVSRSGSDDYRTSEAESDQEPIQAELSGGKDNSTAERTRVWHLRLGHVLNVSQIRRHVTDGTLPRVKDSPTGCGICVKAKFRKSYPGSLIKATTVGHLHAYTKGMIKDRSVNGAHYFFVIVDEYSRFVQAIPIGNKSKASAKVLEFVKWVERKSGHPNRSFYTDGGSEFSLARRTLQEKGV